MRQANHGLYAGLLTSISVGVGYLPVGFSFGIAAVQSDIPPSVALLVSALVYAGASQFLLISLLVSGAGLWAAVPSVLMMNARHMLYGPSLVPRLPIDRGRLPSPVLAFGLTDEVYATAASRLETVPIAQREGWLLGLQCGAYTAWLGGTALGVLFVREVDQWASGLRDGLAFVLPALFFALLLDAGVRRWRATLGVAGAVTALASLALEGHHALVVGMLAGSFVQLARVGGARP